MYHVSQSEVLLINYSDSIQSHPKSPMIVSPYTHIHTHSHRDSDPQHTMVPNNSTYIVNTVWVGYLSNSMPRVDLADWKLPPKSMRDRQLDRNPTYAVLYLLCTHIPLLPPPPPPTVSTRDVNQLLMYWRWCQQVQLTGIDNLNIIFSYMKVNKICNLDHPVY